jgi:hypothetical protein
MDVRVGSLEYGIKFANPCAGVFSGFVASALGWILEAECEGFPKEAVLA